ncbi:hypothetical protein [Burkholderia sp. MSMB1589WGS]|uniref:hypothetical protein n=1 Tax=Burkholderia sp. MSMB1589WGS TaxID=1636425 RepID=UPI0012E7C5BC|nr:hypothetical protein [Burkholderia sp. MSMB1589WGS]
MDNASASRCIGLSLSTSRFRLFRGLIGIFWFAPFGGIGDSNRSMRHNDAEPAATSTETPMRGMAR